MSNIAGLLKAEIIRLSKKVVKEGLAPIQAATGAHRQQLAAMKRQMTELEHEVRRLQRVLPAPAKQRTGDEKHRFVAKGLRSLRTRLGLSAEDLGQLVGVSAQTVYNWEQKKTTPRPEQVMAIAHLRGLGKREIRARLEQRPAVAVA